MFMHLKRQVLRFIKDEEGQSTTEYILILAVVVMVALKFKEQFKNRLEGAVTKLGVKIDSAIEE